MTAAQPPESSAGAPAAPADGPGATQALATQALATQGVCLEIGGAVILDDVTLAVAPGEMLGVIGPNGAGKSTLFNVVSGIATPTAGRVHLDGVDITRTPVHRRTLSGLGRSFQTSSLFLGLPVLENVRLAAQIRRGGGLSLFGGPRRGDAATTRALEHLDAVGLAPRSGVLAGALSHGDKRKLELAVLLATDPQVILLDEPMAGVGMADVDGLAELIGRVNTEQGRTICMVEHHMDVLLGLVDRVAVMHHGRLLAIDTPEAVMADARVQDVYIGTAS